MISTSWGDVDFRRKPSSHFTTAMSSTGSLLVSTNRPALLSRSDFKISALDMRLPRRLENKAGDMPPGAETRGAILDGEPSNIAEIADLSMLPEDRLDQHQ